MASRRFQARMNVGKSAWLAALSGLTVIALAACTSGSAAEPPVEGAGTGKVTAPAIAQNGQLTVCTALSFGTPPNFYFDESHEPKGLEVEMATFVAGHLGLKANIVETAFASLIPTLQAGQCDVIMSSLYIKPEREEVVDFVPYLVQGSAVAVPTGNPDSITGMDDSLCGRNVVAVVGTTAALNSKQQSEKCGAEGKKPVTLSEIDTAAAGAQMVSTGQMDAYAGTSPTVLYYQRESGGSFEVAGEPYGLVDVGAAVKKGNQELHTAIDEAFAEMRKTGTYDQILAKWGQQDMAYKN
jgi:polar amino acid transport system substrate-binding protein